MARNFPAAFLAACLVFSCSPSRAPLPVKAPKAPSVRALTFSDLLPTPEESAWLDERKRSARPLLAATIRVPGAFEEFADGTRRGLDWALIQDFSRVVDLPVQVKVQNNLKAFFSRNGVIPDDLATNSRLVYTPDLLHQVDLYIGPLAVLPWRERLMTMVALYPMQNFLAGRKGEEIHSMAQLSGKRVAVIRNAMQEGLLRGLAEREGLSPLFVYVSPQEDLIDAVSQGRADYTLDGQLFFAQNRNKMHGLTLSPFESDPVRVGWAMKQEDPILASLVRKYFAQAQEKGVFEVFFAENFGTTFGDYMNVLATALPLESRQ